jgi:hypothetical protein
MLSFSIAFDTYKRGDGTPYENQLPRVMMPVSPRQNQNGERTLVVEIDKRKVKTLEDTDEPAPVDQVEERVEAQMKFIEGKAKEEVANGLSNEDLARKGRRMKEDAEEELRQLRDAK